MEGMLKRVSLVVMNIVLTSHPPGADILNPQTYVFFH